MAGSLGNCVEFLLNLLRNSEGLSESKDVLNNISHYFQEEHTRAELDLALSILLNKHDSLIYFIERAIAQSQFKEVVQNALEIVQNLISRHIDQMGQYFVTVKEVCISCALSENASADCKDMAYQIVVAVIENKNLLPPDADLGVHRLLNTVRRELTTKTVPTVQKRLYQLCGVLAEYYPVAVSDYSQQLMRQLIYELVEQTHNTNNVQMQVITGCLLGLTGMLVNFTQDYQENPKNCERIYKCVKKIIQNDEARQRVAHRAALGLLSRHMLQFWAFLYDDYELWLSILQRWALRAGEDRKAGLMVLETFYVEIANHLATRDTNKDKEVLRYFITHYTRIFKSPTAPQHDVTLAIKGFGKLSRACQRLMNQEDVVFMFTLILQRVQQNIVMSEGDTSVSMSHLSDYLESLSDISRELDVLTEEHLLPLKQMCILTVERYPQVPSNYQYTVVNAVMVTIFNISLAPGDHIACFLEDLAYQIVVRMCGHPLVQDAELQKEIENKKSVVTYKSYLSFWKYLFDIQSAFRVTRPGVTSALRQNLLVQLYDALIITLMKLIHRLDLSTKRKTADQGEGLGGQCDPQSVYEANSPNDINVFCNLVELYNDLLTVHHCEHMARWLPELSRAIISRSIKFPLISGFYKLLSTVLQAADTINYFKHSTNNKEDREQGMQLINRFIVDLLIQLHQYKGDLQMSCLQVIISAPVQLIQSIIHLQAPDMYGFDQLSMALQVVFQVGYSYLALAHRGMDALEHWHRQLPPDVVKPLFNRVIPYFDPFLQSTVSAGNTVDSSDTPVVPKSQRLKEKLETVDTELSRLQNRILDLLSRLDTPTSLSLLHKEKTAVKWCSENILPLDIPFTDIRPLMYLDSLAPRVMELALASSDRKTRCLACDVFHSLITVFLGNSTQWESTKRKAVKAFLKKVLPSLLQLGCDPDSYVQQLFHPLVLQIAHYYSSKMMLKTSQTNVFVEVVFDGLTHETDTAVRDFSALCLKEFIKWSIKQLSVEELKNCPFNIENIVKRINNYCLHPSICKRLGAALAFNNLYTEMREEPYVVDMFWLNILCHFVQSLALYDYKDSHQVVIALDHVKRVVVERPDVFNQVSPNRQVPPGLRGCLLKDVVEWLLMLCGSKQTDCRHSCMSLVSDLAPCIQGCTHIKDFINNKEIVGICEGGGSDNILRAEPDSGNMAALLSWFKHLLAALDSYTWLIKKDIANVSSAFLSASSSILSALRQFVSEVSLSSASVVLQKIQRTSSGDSDLNVNNENMFAVSKCLVIVQLFEFVVAADSANIKLKIVWEQSFWHLVGQCILRPSEVGFDWSNQALVDRLCSIVSPLLSALRKQLSEQQFREFTEVLDSLLEIDCSTVLSGLKQILTMGNSVATRTKEFIQGLSTLHKCGQFSSLIMVRGWIGEDIIRSVFTAVTDPSGGHDVLEHPNLVYANSLLKLAYELGTKVEITLNCILDSTQLEGSLTKGQRFLSLFHSCVVDHMLAYPDECVVALFTPISDHTVEIILYLLRHCQYSSKDCHRQQSDKVVTNIVDRWGELVIWASDYLSKKQTVLNVAKRISATYAEQVACFTSPSMAPVKSWLLSQMSLIGESTSTIFKAEVLLLLPCVVPHEEDKEDFDLRRTLDSICSEFPVSCSELPAGSVADIVKIFKQLLHGLQRTGSPTILRAIISTSAHDKKHPCKDDIHNVISKTMGRLSEEKQLALVELAYLEHTTRGDVDRRLGILHTFLLPLVHTADYDVVLKFFTSHVSSIVGLCEVSRKTLEMHNGWEAKQQLISNIGACHLTETMFSSLDESDLLTPGKPLVVASGVKEKEKELMRDVIKKIRGVLNDVQCPKLASPEFKELFRLYICAAYCALISCIWNCANEEKLEQSVYTYVFMLTKTAKAAYIWEMIVPLDKTFTFPVLYNELPKRRKHLVEIKRKSRMENKNQDFMHTVQYLQSQSLYNSTLADDIREFDFTAYSVRDVDEKARKSQFARHSVARMEVELDSGSSDVESLCSHECMPILCATIQYLVQLRMSSEEQKQADIKQVPPDWMKYLASSLRNSQHTNVKIFILHMIVNCQEYLKPYAHLWLSPILEVITRDKCLGTVINAMIHEIVVMMASWSSHAIPDSSEQEKLYASEFLELLIKSTHHERKDVCVYNLQIVRVIVELWKQCLHLPYQLLYDVINPSGGRSTVTGIQLTATMLANGLLPFSSTGKSSFYDALLMNLSKDDRSVYHPCAESIGHILRLLCEPGSWTLKEQDELFFGNVCNKLKTDLVGSSKGGIMREKKQITCIHAIQKNYPPIVNVFMPALLNWAPRIPFMFRVMILEALTTALDFDLCTDGFRLLIEAGLLKFISGRDSETLKAALQLASKLIHQLKAEEINILLPEIFKVSNHSNKQCRALVYDILAWFHDTHYRKKVNEELTHCVSESRKILIRGLADPESELQEKMYKFWSESGRLSSKTHDRVVDILTTLYSVENEDMYIYNAAYFLLDAVSSSLEFSKKIFRAPLSNCKFEDYKVLTSWRVQHASHIPLFTQTRSSQFSDSLGPLGDGAFKLRATQQSLAFQPTLDIGRNEPSTSFASSVEPSLKSSFLFSLGSSVTQMKKHGVLNRYATVETSSTDSDTVTKPFLPIPRKKFIHSKERISKGFAAMHVRRADERKRIQADRIKKREAQVSMSRSYRYGDLPDIEISFKDVIGPLQELSKRDAIVAKQVFVLVFRAVKEEINDICTEVSSAVVSILNSTKHCIPTVIGTLLEVVIMDTTVFTVDETRLTEVCKSSKQLSLGALLMEDKIIKKDSEDLHPPPTKKIKSSHHSDSWVHLAEIYRNMGEMDVVQGIFEDKIDSGYQDHIKTAVQYESEGLWKDAQKTYLEVTDLLKSALHEDFVYQAYYKCSAYLSEWTDLNKTVKAEARDNLDNIWKNSWYVDNLLPWYFTSEIHCILSGKHDMQPFLLEIDRWLGDVKKADHIKTRFGEQLCIVYLLKDEMQHCRLASEHNLKNFVRDWSQLDIYTEKLRVQKLTQLQAMMEIHHYVSLPPVLTDNSVNSLTHYWMSSCPTNSDSLLNWQTRALYRNFCVKQIGQKSSSLNEEVVSALSKAEVNTQLSLIDCALTQRNFYVARKYIKNTQSKVSGLESNVWTLNYSKAFLLRAQISYKHDSLKDTMSLCASSWEKLKPLLIDLESVEPPLQLLVYQHIAHISNTISSYLVNQTSTDIHQIEAGTLRVLHEIIRSTDVSPDRLYDSFYKEAVCSLKQAVKCAVNHMEGNVQNPKLTQLTASAYLELAKLCLQKVSPLNESVLIESLLRAMCYGSHEARQLFPCLLQLDSVATSNSQLFIDESCKVPEWMFLQWVSQLLATLDTRKCTAIAPSVYRLARAYPVAIRFPFQLSLELYKNTHNTNKSVVDELSVVLQCDSVTTSFLQALTCLCQPNLLLEYHIKKLYQAIDHGKEEVDAAYKILVQESFPSDVSECIKGSSFNKIKTYKADIDKALEHLRGPTPDCNSAKRELKKLQGKVLQVTHCDSTELEAYSPWLKKFNQESCGNIEIPGQYTGKCRPNPQYHTTISKFKEKVKVMNSIRRPIRLIILGNDAKDHKFLVKFAEDLRQDQRIQQLFSLMNQIFSNNPDTASKQLFIDTYGVVPLNTRLGMIEWIDSTKLLRLVMLDSESLGGMSNKAKEDYFSWLSAALHDRTGRPDNVQLHISALTRYSREETVSAFRRRQRIFPHDLLRKAVFKMASSLEAYVYLRSQVLTSHAVMCICHWLLGIGDRHLSNTLVSLKTGRFLGIDFGCAFGTAADLPVPELIPFRLTPCIVDLAAPMYLAGLLQETMVHVLQILRQNHMVLSATMQVFIQEPTVNWLEAIQNKSKEQNISSLDENSCQWYAEHKISAVKSKLCGAHPCKIMEDDLMLSIHKTCQHMPKLKQLLWGNGGESKRMSLLAKEHLSAREQVECLLDQATDEHILGKGWMGLELWI